MQPYPDARRRLPDFPFPGLLRSHRAWNHVTPSGSIQTLARIRFLFRSMLDTCGWACPAWDKDGPNG
jgi:hypothetical protein